MIEASGPIEALRGSLDRAGERADARGKAVLASATVQVEVADPCAAVFASRLATDEWFCWSEPERGFELAALGSAASVIEEGAERFSKAADACAELIAGACVAGEGSEGGGASGELPAGAGPVWVGGFAFADGHGGKDHWSSFPASALTLPELSFAKHDARVLATINLMVPPGADRDALSGRASRRLAALEEEPLGLLDPHPAIRSEIEGRHAPEHFERAVAEAVETLDRDGKLSKAVLAREITVRSPAAHDAGAIFGALRDGFPSCFCFCRGTREGAFLGASPELLVRRSGSSAITVALAGSARRSSDPALDDHLGEQLLQSRKDRREQEIVTERIVRALRPHSVWVQSAPEPGLAKVANIQHLATPIVAQLASSRSAVELAGLLHPTPAVGGEPWPDAAPVVERLEQLDRGWYAGPVGWMDSTGDGEFCVALRSALLRDRDAHLYAGVGVVADSDPASELAETELKLGALMPLFDL